MYRVSLKAAFAALMFVTMAIPAAAGEYRDASGFSFTYPSGWVAVTKPGKGLQQALPPEIDRLIKQNNLDLDKIAVALIRNGQDSGENLNVVVLHQEVPVTNDVAQELGRLMQQQFQGAGITILSTEARVQTIGSKQAIVIEYQTRVSGLPMLLKQKQAFFVGGGKTCIVTCTATADGYAKHAAAFDAILASFKTPTPVARGLTGN